MEFEIPQTDTEIFQGYSGLQNIPFDYDEHSDTNFSILKKTTKEVIKSCSTNPFLLHTTPQNYLYLHTATRHKLLDESVTKIVDKLCDVDYDNFTMEKQKIFRSVLKMVTYLLSVIPVNEVIIDSLINIVNLPIDGIFPTPDVFFLEKIKKIAIDGIDTRGISTKKLNVIFNKLTGFNHVEMIVSTISTLLKEDKTDVTKIANVILKNNSVIVQKFLRMLTQQEITNGKLIKNITVLFPLLPSLIPDDKMRLPSWINVLLDNNDYNLRNAVIECYTQILIEQANDQLFDSLTERLHDINSFVRGKTLQMWQVLVEEHAIPLERFNKLTENVIERLNDKTSTVRKNAIGLLQSMLMNNPYSVVLKRELFLEKMEQTNELLNETIKKPLMEAIEKKKKDEQKQKEKKMEEEISDIERSEDHQSTEEKMEEENDENEKENDEENNDELIEVIKNNLMQDDEDENNDDDEFAVPMDQIKTLFEGTGFQHIADEELVETKKREVLKNFIKWLMNSIEFIDLFESSLEAIDKILEFNTSVDIKEAIKFFGTVAKCKIAKGVSCLKRTLELLFNKQVQNVETIIVESVQNALCQESPQNTVNNLLIITNNSNIGEEMCLKRLIELLVQRNVIGQQEVDYLWSYVVEKLPMGGELESLTALSVLSFIAYADFNLVYPKLHVLSSVCFKEDQLPTYVYRGCQVLLRMFQGNQTPHSDHQLERISIKDPLITQIIKCLDNNYGPNTWISLIQIVLDVVYISVDHPNEIAEELLKRRAYEVHQHSSVSNVIKMLSLVGGIVRKQGEYYDKLKDEIQDQVEKKKQNEQSKRKKANRLSTKQINEMCDLRVQEKTKEMLESLLNSFIPIINKYVSDIIEENKYSGDIYYTFRAVVFNTLCSFMMVDQSYCEQHLQTIFTILNADRDECIRSNIIYYIGDFASKYPNDLDGWMPKVYEKVVDPHETVRRSAVIVLSELIFHGIIKVKGDLYYIALALVDKEQRIRDLAHTFFHDYSSKKNAIQDALPDLISKLGNADIPKEQFEYIMKFIMSFIVKDKENEMFVNKLIKRFTENEQTVRQWSCTAYCLSLLNYNEKSLKMLVESLKKFSNKLHVKEVKESFLSLCHRIKKGTKQELKPIVENFEKIIVKEGGDEDDMEIEEINDEKENKSMEEEE